MWRKKKRKKKTKLALLTPEYSKKKERERIPPIIRITYGIGKRRGKPASRKRKKDSR